MEDRERSAEFGSGQYYSAECEKPYRWEPTALGPLYLEIHWGSQLPWCESLGFQVRDALSVSDVGLGSGRRVLPGA